MNILFIVGLINLVIWLFVTTFFLIEKRIPFYHPIFSYLLYHFLGFVARPFVAMMPDANVVWDYIGFDPSSGDLLFSCFAANSAILAFAFGALMVRTDKEQNTTIPLRHFKISRNGLFAITFIFFGVISILATKSNGTFNSELQASYEIEIDDAGGQRMVGVSGYQTAAENFSIGLIMMLPCLFGLKIWTLAAIVPWLLFRIWLGVGRWAFILPLFLIGGISAWYASKRFPSIFFVGLLILALPIFNILGGNREAFRLWADGEYSLSDLISDYRDQRGGDYSVSDFQEFETSTFLYSVIPEKTGWNYGTQYLRLFVWPIPRQWWPDKPVYTSLINLNNLGNVFGLSLSMHADFYSIIGIPSLILGMGVVGYGLQRFYNCICYTSNVYLFFLYWIILMELPQWFRDGGVTIIFFTTFIYLPIAFCLWLGKVRMTDNKLNNIFLQNTEDIPAFLKPRRNGQLSASLLKKSDFRQASKPE